jgi:hypothetical protein
MNSEISNSDEANHVRYFFKFILKNFENHLFR